MNTLIALLLIIVISVGRGYQPQPPQNKAPDTTRRTAFLAFPAALGILATAASPSMALDIDGFMAQELSSSKKVEPKMTEDEALCRFGSPSRRTGEACLRAGMSTKRPTGVDAFGTIDRGDFVRCKPNYVDDPKNKGMLINVWDCK